MISDPLIIRIELKDGFREEIKRVCAIQASRDNPRKIVSAFVVDNTLNLLFELIDNKVETTTQIIIPHQPED